ncbi:MAG: hypothetical protein C5B49_13015, partial [Bdellovibrio sp.]
MPASGKKEILVTGAGRGLGRSIAVKLSADGFLVRGCARSEGELQETRRMSGGRVEISCVDVTSRGQLSAWIKKNTNENSWGLVTAAGIYGAIGR